MTERSRDRSSSAESQPKFPGCSHFRRRNDNHFRCQQCRLNEGLTLCTQDKPCLVCKDWLPEAWAAQAKANAQKTRCKAAAAAKEASERETMDDSIEIHAPEEALQLPSKRASSDGSSKSKRTKTKARSSGSCEPKSVVSSVSAVERPSSHGSDRRRSRSADRKRRHWADKRQDSPRHQWSRRDSGRREGEWSSPSSSGGSSSRRRAESSSVSKASDTRPSASSSHHRHHPSSGDQRSLSSASSRASPDRKSPPSHHERRWESADRTGHSYVARREVQLSPKIVKPPEKKLSLWSLRWPGSFKLMSLLQWRVQRRWRTARQATARPQLTARPQWTARPQLMARPQLTARQATARPVTARQATVRPVTARRTARPQLIHLTAQLFSLMARRSRTTLHVIRRREWTGRQVMEPWQEPRHRWTKCLRIDRDKQSAFPINTDLHQPGNADRLYVFVDIITASDGPGYGSRYLGQPGCSIVSACSQTWLTPTRSDTQSRTPERRPRTPEPRTPQRSPRTPVRRVRTPVRQARGQGLQGLQRFQITFSTL